MRKTLTVLSLFLALSSVSFASQTPHKAYGMRGVKAVGHGIVVVSKKAGNGLAKAFHFLVA